MNSNMAQKYLHYYGNESSESLLEAYGIVTKTYAEQEQIYKGFIKLIEQQRELLVARKDLVAKLKDSVQEPIALNNKIKQPQPSVSTFVNNIQNLL